MPARGELAVSADSSVFATVNLPISDARRRRRRDIAAMPIDRTLRTSEAVPGVARRQPAAGGREGAAYRTWHRPPATTAAAGEQRIVLAVTTRAALPSRTCSPVSVRPNG